MTTNPEIPLSSSQAPEVQQLIESSRAEAGALSEEVSAVSGTKSELNGFGKFFSKLWDARKELKNWNISKAVAILFWTDQQESHQTSWSSTNTWSAESTTATDTQSESKENEPKDTDLVSVEKYINDVKLDMRYATKNNFTWEVVYDSAEAKLRYWTIKKLSKAQESLKKQWYSLKIWDAYRPQSAQDKFKKIVKDSSLVAQWKSDHTKGCAVDVTLVKSDGTEIPMPSEFDDFKHKNKCKSDFSAVSWEAKNNWQILQKAMSDAGFWTIWSEWWHFYDKNKGNYGYT